MQQYNFFATTSKGLEQALCWELGRIGVKNPEIVSGGVQFEGSQESYYRANLYLRTAIRVLLKIKDFPCESYDELYARCRDIDWLEYLGLSNTLAVDCNCRNSVLTHSQYGSRKVKDAIVDQFRDKTGRRPDVDPKSPDVRINAHIFNNHCILSLDTSGESLHLRGYRKLIKEAPMKETLAAGIIDYSGWDCNVPLYDPMCGSGTILIEAVLKAANVAPGLLRRDFGFHRWRSFDRALWQKLVNEAEQKVKRNVPCRLYGSDIDADAVRTAAENARAAALVDRFIKFEVRDVTQFRPQADSGVIITNPPYGERMGEKENLKDFYKQLGDVLKHNCKGHTAFLLIGDTELVKSVGLRTSQKLIIHNGPIECRLTKYEIY